MRTCNKQFVLFTSESVHQIHPAEEGSSSAAEPPALTFDVVGQHYKIKGIIFKAALVVFTVFIFMVFFFFLQICTCKQNNSV